MTYWFIVFLVAIGGPILLWLAFWAVFLIAKALQRRRQVAQAGHINSKDAV